MQVLIVDDDQVDRELISRTLQKSDLKVNITSALTVDEGLDLFKNNHFDIVLSDYRMPQRDGIELILELQNEPKDIGTAIVMMSSSEDEQLALECIKAGAQDFLIKSEITAARLRRAVLHAQARYELEQRLYQSYQKVKHLAESDPLTGLANRYLFDESLKVSIVNNLRDRFKIALLLIDLDHFKNINDSLGHDVGDLLLKRVVKRIQGCLRGNELFARLGGDEFAITLSNLESPEHASRVARRILGSLENPIKIANTEIKSTASIGIAIHPDNGNTAEELFKYSDIAMYRAKKLGRNQMCFFENDMQEQFSDRMLIEQELRDAEENGQFLLHYQPIVNPINEEVLGFEALIRWDIHGGIRFPDEFIPVAEETRKIIDIGRWVFREAISTLAKWNANNERQYSLSINLSSIQLDDPSLVSHIEECLAEFDVPHSLIEIELTETALLGDSAVARNVISKLDDIGCRIALDDFGTGFSSVSHLQKFPISTVKIDKSLMPKEGSSKKDEQLLRGLISMVQILGLNIIAEGVEVKEHVELCIELGISQTQGYYYSKPLNRVEIENQYIHRFNNAPPKKLALISA